MSLFGRKGSSLHVCCVLCLFGLLSGELFATELPDTVKPQSFDSNQPTLDIPLPDENEEEEALQGLSIPPKRERLPEERTIKVTRFMVGRLTPRNQVSGECVETNTQGFCLVSVQEPALTRLLTGIVAEYQAAFTIFDLEDVAFRVTNYFRNRDLILDTAFIPPQDVRDNTVAIHVLQGRLGKISVKGNERYDADVLSSPFEHLLGKPVTRQQITHSLLTVWDYPGLSLSDRRAQVTFFPGSSVGETDIEMEVFEEETPYNLSLSIDNNGSEYSGVYRGSLNLAFNNPLGMADQLSLSLARNADPANGEFYSINYKLPVFTPDYTFGIGGSKNDFQLSGGDFEGFSGVSKQIYIGLDRVFIQSFRSRLAGGIKFSRKNAETLRMGEEQFEDKLAVLNLAVDYMTTDQWLIAKGANQTRMIVDVAHGFGDLLGSMPSENAENASRTLLMGEKIHQKTGAEFDKVTFEVTRKQQFIADTTLWFRFDGQYSPDGLVSLEQFSLGGPNSVRAYPTSEFLRDKGYFISLEWASELPFFKESIVPAWLAGDQRTTWGRALTLSLFTDYAKGWLNYGELDGENADEYDRDPLRGAGVAVRFQTSLIHLNMSLATPLGGMDPSNDENPQFFANLMIQFY